ncbi:MAG: hypothetical protein IT372_09895, partial [Polyangiaceae bacterium]|nr:hypothetical protein [Polyangiaceae bacterium]
MRSRWWTRVGLFPLFGVVAAACGSDDFSGDRAASGDLDEAAAGSAAAGAGQAEAIARASLRAAYVQAVQRSASEEYAIDRSDRVLRALNPSQGLRADFDVEEARVAPLVEGGAGWSWTVTPSRWGCADDLSPVSGAAPEASGNRVEYRREGLTEWYVNGPLGVEQGFTVPEAPACRRAGGGELVIELRAAEGLTTTLLHGDREAALEDASGEAVLRYMDLHVSDAEGKALPARLGLTEGRLSIRIEDAGAAYPLVVDPLVAAEWGKLVAADVNAWDQYGGAVALSGDTAIIGAPLNAGNSGSGAAYVFVRSGSTWAFQAKLAPGDGAADDNFGASVGIDGDIAIVGAPHDDDMGTDSGAAYVFVRSGAPPTWSQEKKLIPSGTASGHQFGRSVGVSADGVIVSGSVEQFYPGSGTSCASIFTGIGSTWSEWKLNSYGQCGPVAISGSTAVAGSGDFVDAFKIGIHVTCNVNVTGPRASTVAISGNTIVIGHDDEAMIGIGAAPYGRAVVYTSAGGCWTPQQTLVAGNGYDYFGHSVA